MVAEAGIIGKIGMNSKGVGTCLNAIKARGVSYERLPVHLALRAALESGSAREAVELLERAGVAASAHILVADGKESVGLETSSRDVKRIGMNEGGRVCHTNHYILSHPGIEEVGIWDDSAPRLARIEELAVELAEKEREGKEPSMKGIEGLLCDENGFPCSINRHEREKGSNAVSPTAATLFSVVMDLRERRAEVKLGRPSEPDEIVELRP